MTTQIATERVFNFSAGPAVLPLPVLEQIRDEMVSLPGVGSSILEISHRGREFVAILDDARQRLRQLLAIGDNHEVLFLQGGARLQFSMIPMNLAPPGQPAGSYIISGSWSNHAYKEAKLIGQPTVGWDGAGEKYVRTPSAGELSTPSGAAYVYFASNETIQGVQFQKPPCDDPAPLVCDASSDFLSRPMDFSQYGLVYACAQKNAGPAGVTIVVIDRQLLSRAPASLPGYLNFRNHAENDSLYNTAPTFGIYVVGLVCRWIQQQFGGLPELERHNRDKAAILYQLIDGHSEFYHGHARPADRSMMNVTFRLDDDTLDARFLSEAESEGLCALKGHRSVGGIRASIYNAMPVEGVRCLAEFMRDFARKNG